ncbi:MAG: alpha/beta hydrolase [Parvibaculaceae bacterium]
MIFPPIADWDDAYTNSTHIAGGEAWFARWAEAAEAFRGRIGEWGSARLDLAYGPGPRHRLDLFLPEAEPRGLVVFVHGGYWMRFDKSSWSHLAEGALGRGFAVALPSYTLCPDIRIAGIAREVAAAIAFAAREVGGPLRLAGHSAGGQIVCRMMSLTSPLAEDVRRRVVHVLSISGVHDLRPLLKTRMNKTLGLDREEALAESPALDEPAADLRLTCWAGAGERAEFIRQNALMANVWRGLGAATRCVTEDNRHHYDVVEGLRDPQSPLTKALFDA